jgi:hypothetical protein
MERIHIDIEERLRHEAMVCRHPPIEYVVGEDGGRVVHRPNPDYAMAELLEDAATVIANLRGAIRTADNQHQDFGLIDMVRLRAALETFK